MNRFGWKIFWCLLPVVLAAAVVARAYVQYEREGGGFKLGVDLVGGTILVYEVDESKSLQDSDKRNTRDELAAALKRRIDPADLYNITIRPVGAEGKRVEIILPTGGLHQQQLEEADWQKLLNQVKAHWPDVDPAKLDNIPLGKIDQLIDLLRKDHPDKVADIETFMDENYQGGRRRRTLTEEAVNSIKDKISQVGSLEFRILANARDDDAAMKKAEEFFETKKNKEQETALKNTLEKLALEGKVPPPPAPPEGQPGFEVTNRGYHTYSWVELDPHERHNLELDNAMEKRAGRTQLWALAASAREKMQPMRVDMLGGALLYSRKCEDLHLPPEERARKKYEYFLLTRDPERDERGVPMTITGQYLVNAYETIEEMRPAVGFRFDTTGGNLFYDITSKNSPEGTGPGSFKRHLAIILDGKIVTAPSINQAIRTDGRISGGNFTKKEVDNYVTILRSGALPATLKPQPVSENTMGATLGSDTIRDGTISVAIAFGAILLFMLVYYRFAGLVACVALLANLLLTVGFMVAVNATFTLPGLAGLVLMLGMAVDANVLIYERLREERDRGASLALALRNGYDRAFPTIIDTHLSSIFTAIVLYAVGNDQLKGFGISLTVGLIISLFTSLYMTRLLFDIWQTKGWLRKLSMFRLFSRPSIDFMGIRYYWFTATILLTLFGITVFLIRGQQGLNIDFTGGTAYGGQLTEAVDITRLRELFSSERQKERLNVVDVKQQDTEGHAFEIDYGDGTKRTVTLSDKFTPDELKARARELPDLSVEQIFLSSFAEDSRENKSRFFTIRTSEKAQDLVRVSVDRLLGNLQKQITLTYSIDPSKKAATLNFTDFASPAQMKMLIDRELRAQDLASLQAQSTLNGMGEEKDGRYKQMRFELSEPVAGNKLDTVLKRAQEEAAARPQPERLEVFDSQLAQDTQLRAMYAILASWAAILLYLWFRFGNWTFGLAAVLCLIHDLFFTMGIIAFCHYIHAYWPGVAGFLKIQDFKIDLPAVAALLTLVGYSVNDTIVVFDRIREVRGKNPLLTPQMINDSVNQTLSRTLLTSFATWLVVIVLYLWGGEGVHLFAFVMVIGVIVGTYSSIYIASPLLLIFGEGAKPTTARPQPEAQPAGVA
ncbi:MAG TPA: protein translocase subunit SecD [Gemmataceae bacterium]|nr:protein translocase subunit SecD [Gemmataceae bacterium]